MTSNVPGIQFTSVGFVAPQAPAVLAGVQLDIDAAFGRTLNYGLTTPQGQLAQSWGAIIVNANSIFIYYAQQFDPSYNSGRFQDAVARIYFLERKPSQPTALQVACIGAAGVVIPSVSTGAPALVQDVSKNLYQCVQSGTVPVGGSITLAFEAVVPGPIAVPQAVTIVQSISQWDAALVITGIIGRNVESRAEFEARRKESVAGNSNGPMGPIIAAVAAVPGVLDYYGYNNNTNAAVTISGVLIAANSIYVAAAGGAPADVAKAIWSKKSPGAPMVGNTTVTVYDTNPLYAAPIPYTIKYQIPTALQFLFKVSIASGPGVPSNAVQQVQTALLTAFSGNALSASFTGSISGTSLTVSAIDSGAISLGQIVSDLTGNLDANTIVTAFGTGDGGVGTYSVSISQTVLSEPMTSALPINNVSPSRARIASTVYAIQYVSPIAALGPWAQVAAISIGSANTPDAVVRGHILGNTLTVTSVTSGALVVGDALSDSANSIVNATFITVFGTGTGGVGDYTVNNPQNFGATFTGTGSGVNLTVTSVTGSIAVGDTVVGSGVPGNTTISSQTSGPPGGAGVYVTSNVTTSVGASLTANRIITAASANQTLVSVHADQEPQLVAASIMVNLT